MRYCRWSSDGFMCDVYVYENVSGKWTTHVADNRILERAPERWWNGITDEEFHEANEKYNKHMDTVGRESIGLPHDGETFDDDTPGECADTLKELKRIGYNVPQYAIDELRNESRQALEETK